MKLKKNEIVVYAIALMLVAAGYFNYVTFDKKTIDTYSEDLQNENEGEEVANTGDAVLVTNNEIENKEENPQNDNTVNTNISATTDEEDYYASSKLDRDKMYAEMISSYEAILNNQNVTEVQKSIATQEIAKINNNKNAIMICENLILTKGFNNCVIFINEKTINAVVSIDGGLETKSVAQIQNIISRELNTEIENIHITER